MKKFRNPSTVSPPIAYYSHQTEVHDPMRWLIVSGQLGQRADGALPEDPVEQLAIAFENVIHNLQAAEMEIEDVVKLTIYLVGEVDVTRRRAVISSYLKEHRPCVTMVFVAALAAPQYKVEVEAWASRALQ